MDGLKIDWGNLVPLDFEFTRSQEPKQRLFCASLIYKGERRDYWLLDNPKEKERLVWDIHEMHQAGATFVAFASTAEARCFLDLGINPLKFRWIDSYSEFRQLVNHLEKYRYGRQWIRSKATGAASLVKCWPEYRFPNRRNDGPETNLLNALLKFLGVEGDANRKDATRDLILQDRRKYSATNRRKIMDYCFSDVVHLVPLALKMRAKLKKALPAKYWRDLDSWILSRGQYAADLAVVAAEGIPLDLEAIKTLSANFEAVKDQTIRGVVENHFPFWVQQRKTKKSPLAWVEKADRFAEFVRAKGLATEWPRTESGAFSKDQKALKDFSYLPEVDALRRAKDTIKQLSWYRPEVLPEFLENVGRDGRLRLWFGPFGTQTSRNAPRAKLFIPAQSSWLRAVIRPPAGWVVIGADYGSQEFAVAAELSEDKNMAASYLSGDPYMYFGKLVGMIPEDGTKETHGTERQICKGVILGLQFGMGAQKLALQLSATLGRWVKVREAEKYISQHKKAYRGLWEFMEGVSRKYRAEPLVLLDGWALFQDNPSALSVRNFPIQGTGGSILRRAVARCHQAGLRIIFPLHDAVYILAREGKEAEFCKKVLVQEMTEATRDILGPDSLEIRVDAETHSRAEVWVEEKGASMFEYLAPHCGIDAYQIGGHWYYKEGEV